MRRQVQEVLERAQKYVGRVEVVPVLPSSEVTVDGRRTALEEDGFLVEPGERLITVSADGYQTLKRKIVVDSGETVVIELTREQTDTDATDDGPSQAVVAEKSTIKYENDTDKSSSDLNLLPWIVLSASTIVGITGAVLFGMGLNDISELESVEEGTYYDEIDDVDQRASTFTTVGPVLFGVGIAGAIVGVVLLSLDGDEKRDSTTLSLTPVGIVLKGDS